MRKLSLWRLNDVPESHGFFFLVKEAALKPESIYLSLDPEHDTEREEGVGVQLVKLPSIVILSHQENRNSVG